jgi:hypothetical protein
MNQDPLGGRTNMSPMMRGQVWPMCLCLRLILAERLFSKTFDLAGLVVTNRYLELYYLFWLELVVGVMLRDWPLGGRFL